MKSGTGAPGRAAKPAVAISTVLPPTGALLGKKKRPVSLPALSKNTSMARLLLSPPCGPHAFWLPSPTVISMNCTAASPLNPVMISSCRRR